MVYQMVYQMVYEMVYHIIKQHIYIHIYHIIKHYIYIHIQPLYNQTKGPFFKRASNHPPRSRQEAQVTESQGAQPRWAMGQQGFKHHIPSGKLT